MRKSWGGGLGFVWALLLMGLVSCREPVPPPPPPDLEAARQELLAVDREFAAVTAERGVEGWVGYFAEDGLMLPDGSPDRIQGKVAVRAAMEPMFAQEGTSLEWTPDSAFVSSSADLGYTIGNYVFQSLDEEGNSVRSEGKYVTIWRKQPDGQWKVVLDIGNSNQQ